MRRPEKPRTQAQRRARTQAALLDAVLACLVEDGYAGLTTRRVAQRAGVSQGTQQHYWATKSELVVEAMRHAARTIETDVRRRIELSDLADPVRQGDLLDEIWRIHCSPTFKAALELWVAARTDRELRRKLRRLEREIVSMIAAAVGERDPDGALFERVELALAAVRGLAMLAPVVPQSELERTWSRVRAGLLAGVLSEP